MRAVRPAPLGTQHAQVAAGSAEAGTVLDGSLAARGGEDGRPGRVVGRRLQLVGGGAGLVPLQPDPADQGGRTQVDVDPLWIFAGRARPPGRRLAVDTAFFAAQQPLAVDAVTGRLRDSSTGPAAAASMAAGWPVVVPATAAPVKAAVAASAVPASTATPLIRALIGPPTRVRKGFHRFAHVNVHAQSGARLVPSKRVQTTGQACRSRLGC